MSNGIGIVGVGVMGVSIMGHDEEKGIKWICILCQIEYPTDEIGGIGRCEMDNKKAVG